MRSRSAAALLLAFERAERETDERRARGALLTFVVVGAGPTGVELAGAIVEIARAHAVAGDFRAIDPRQARVVLIEAGPRVLPAFPEELSAGRVRSLERLGVEVLTGTRVTAVDAARRAAAARSGIAASTVRLGGRRRRLAAGGWIGAAARPRRARPGRARPVGPGASRGLRHRRHGGGGGCRRPAGAGQSRRRRSRWGGMPARMIAARSAGRRRAAALRVPAPWRPGDDRPPLGGRGDWTGSA